MAIYRSDSEIRVERSEDKTRNQTLFGSACFLILAFMIGVTGTAPDRWLIAAGILVFGAFLGWLELRRRQVCIIRPHEIEYGSIGGRTWSFDRSPIVGVRVVDSMFVQVLCRHSDGVERESFVLHNFDANELREAFEEAGVPAR